MQWWRDAVLYQVYVRSFSDSDGDGVGDLNGVRSRLGYLELLGVDGLWLCPFYPSPMADHGYDITDPRDVDPVYGNLDIFDALVADAHQHELRLTIGLVPNHTSTDHEWFRAALNSAPGSPERARYHFRTGRGPGGAEPPNDWVSAFGGPAWTRVADGEWYLHLFSPGQPDLNWGNPEVWADMEKTLRHWLDRGVDGVHIEAAHAMAKPGDFPGTASGGDEPFDHDDVHEVHRLIRSVVDHYPGRMLAGKIPVDDDERFAPYLRPDELHLAWGGWLIRAPFDADEIRAAIERTIAAVRPVGVPPVWSLSDHDVSRPPTRYGGGPVGTARARAMALVELALPGVVSLYNGEELGLPDVDIPDELLEDLPGQQGQVRGRIGARVPLPWEGGPPGFGFTEGTPWLPMPPEWEELSVAAQIEDISSTFSLFRAAIELRRTHPGFQGDTIEWFGAPPGCLAFRRADTTLVCALNASDDSVPLPPGEPLLASGPLDAGGYLPPNTAVWLA